MTWSTLMSRLARFDLGLGERQAVGFKLGIDVGECLIASLLNSLLVVESFLQTGLHDRLVAVLLGAPG